jgi:hypothetical protein
MKLTQRSVIKPSVGAQPVELQARNFTTKTWSAPVTVVPPLASAAVQNMTLLLASCQ